MNVKKLLPLLLLLTFITLFGCAASEANSNGKSVEANENETETKDIKSDNLDKAEKLTEASSLRAEANSALKNAGDASQNENSHEAYARHYYEVRNYTVNHISITKESDRNLYDVEVYVDAPYGECVFTHRITPKNWKTISGGILTGNPTILLIILKQRVFWADGTTMVKLRTFQ